VLDNREVRTKKDRYVLSHLRLRLCSYHSIAMLCCAVLCYAMLSILLISCVCVTCVGMHAHMCLYTSLSLSLCLSLCVCLHMVSA
jgi:hypothetical protein